MRIFLAFAIVTTALIAGGCSLDPIGELFLSDLGPYTEQVGPYLRITFNPGPDLYPSWSRDGTRIAYSAWGFEETTQGQITVNVIPSSGGVSSRISPVFSRIDFNLHPCWLDGDNALAYISFGGLNFIAPLEPFVTIVDANDIQDYQQYSLALNSPLDFGVSPDGNAIAYSDFLLTSVYTGDSDFTDEISTWNRSDVVSSTLTAIWYAEFPLTGEPRKVEGTDGAHGLSWSTGSDSLAFSRADSIYLISVQGGTPEQLFEGGWPAWSPDGTRIACVIDGNLFIYRFADGERTQITTEGGVDPAWSPDGEQIAFSWERNGNFDIYVVELADVMGN